MRRAAPLGPPGRRLHQRRRHRAELQRHLHHHQPAGRHGDAGAQAGRAEPGQNGQPNLQATRRLVFSKAAAGSPSSKAPSKPAPAAGGQDGQISQFLTRNAWCGFTYNKNTGTSTKERVVFYSNGTVARTSGAETYNSGPAGSVAGQYGSANQGRWKVANGMLHLSPDGTN